MPVKPVDIRPLLAEIPQPACGWIAFSGGSDSTALLHMLCSQRQALPMPVRAIHVDHQLHPDSRQWAEHCRRLCRQLDIDLDVVTVDAKPVKGESPEAHARKLRYRAMLSLLQEGDVLFTAHHREDQAETLLLQLVRGAGAEGMASMPGLRPLDKGWLARPLLHFSKRELEGYNAQQGLDWIEDDSNRLIGMDRNYLRHEIMPKLAARWPAAVQTLCRSAAHQAELMQLGREFAEIDAGTVIADDSRTVLLIPALLALSRPRQKNLLRHWIKSQCRRVPGSHLVNRILDEIIPARADAGPALEWYEFTFRRHRQRLYLLVRQAAVAENKLYAWDLRQPLHLPHGVLLAQETTGNGVHYRYAGKHEIKVAFRKGGESLLLPGRQHRQTLKNLLREADVPVWQRQILPLLYIDGKLAAVANHWIDQAFLAGPGESGCLIVFQPTANQDISNQC